MGEMLEQRIGYQFRDKQLLTQALTHRSLAKNGNQAHNQRMEFLGDAVLGLLVADMLYDMYPEEVEGDLSKRLVSLVNGEQLAAIAGEMGLGEYLHLANSEEEQGGRTNPSNLEDAVEALLGAIYLDGGLEAGRALIERFWKARAEATKAPPKDAKTTLQEWAQARDLPLPVYEVLSSEGPAHAPLFVIEVQLQGQKPVRGEAKSKKLAERYAAEAMLAEVDDA